MKTDDRYLQLAEGQVFVRRWTPESLVTSTPLILLHDSLGCVDLWRDFPERLAEALERPVIAYDRLGYGRSDSRQALPSLGFIQEEAELYFPPLVRALGLERYALLGHSVGGPMAVTLAAIQGKACEWVVTLAAQAFVEVRTLEGIRKARGEFGRPEVFERLARWHGEKARWVLDAWTEIWLSEDFADWTLKPWAQQLQVPLLAIHGDEDEYASLASPEALVSAAGGPARSLILEGCGHFPQKEEPQTCINAIREFARG
ncbi:alpha/beta fold hydrolase [Marinospirillum perlucidum]|uniref:alpha/beta fold hydrolase n=1 Tax=Marinospirillum perlucidum TaxID=1982602 RepID=UPI000DF46F6C|nr:alpha/beta hydrolase [Marinospirillum perlucidum]